MLDIQQEEQLTRGGDCFLHHHSSDRTPTQDMLAGLQGVANQVLTTTSRTLRPSDDHLLVDATAGMVTITLPLGRGGKEYEVTKVAGSAPVLILPTSPDTIMGVAGVTFSSLWTSIRLKATDSNNWIAI